MTAQPRFRAVALDYDGTLATGARPDADVLAALADVRAAGTAVVLVTGRILAELRHVFPDVDAHVDVVVAENGTVVSGRGGHRRLVTPVPAVLEDALNRRGVPVRGGEVLLACDGVHGDVVFDEIHRLGLDCQVLHNRAALMILPAGTSKGLGLRAALGDLGISPHDAIGVGDAENDHALLDTCEVGVAVADAVASLRERADVVLDEPDGAGVVELLRGPLVRGDEVLRPERWSVPVGRDPGGSPVRLPGTPANVLVAGGSNTGKSYLGGLFAEGLVERGYTVVVIDVEGDHAGLSALPSVLLMGGAHRLPTPDEVCAPVCRVFASVVVDLSLLPPNEQDEYSVALLAAIAESRRATGLPHWVFVDEAHRPFGADRALPMTLDPPADPALADRSALDGTGQCLITWVPASLRRDVLAAMDVVVALPARRGAVGPGSGPGEAADGVVTVLAARGGTELVDSFAAVLPGQALLVGAGGRTTVATVSSRRTTHVRHWHKYAYAELPDDKRFRFRDRAGETGQVAANTYEFHHLLRACDEQVVAHHVAGRDFSSWARESLQDDALAADLATIEHDGAADVAATRERLVRAVERRYRS